MYQADTKMLTMAALSTTVAYYQGLAAACISAT